MKTIIKFPQLVIESREIEATETEIELFKTMDIDEQSEFIWSRMTELERNCTHGIEWLKSAIDNGYAGFVFKLS